MRRRQEKEKISENFICLQSAIDKTIDDLNIHTNAVQSTPLPIVIKTEIKTEPQFNDQNKSRRGRVIKKTKYLYEELEDTPAAPVKRKRLTEGAPSVPPPKIKKVEETAAEEPATETDIGTLQNIHYLKYSIYCMQSTPFGLNRLLFYSCFLLFFVLLCPVVDVDITKKILTNENILVECDVEIVSSLQLSGADPTRCLSTLEKLKGIDFTTTMLKKNPHIVETIKRLRRYVGNTKSWNYTDEESKAFEVEAQKIRKVSEIIYKMFKV